MNLVDSSGWLEYMANGKNVRFFAPAIEDPSRLIVPTISLLEVFKRVQEQRDEPAALQGAALMHQATVVGLDSTLALAAARLSAAERLPLADSVILATARSLGATLWTQDADFEGRAGVRYLTA